MLATLAVAADDSMPAGAVGTAYGEKPGGRYGIPIVAPTDMAEGDVVVIGVGFTAVADGTGERDADCFGNPLPE
jgi:hypothetical protein